MKYQFILKIDLVEGIETPQQVARALTLVASQLVRMEAFDGDSCGIRNEQGQHIGNWKHDYPEVPMDLGIIR